MGTPAALIKAALLTLTDEGTRKKVGSVLTAILFPIIVLVALLCMVAGAAENNASTADLCFLGGTAPPELDDVSAQQIYEMRMSLTTLDTAIAEVQAMTASGSGLSAMAVKASFFTLCFGGDGLPLAVEDAKIFVDCFVSYEQTMRYERDEDGNVVLVEHTTASALSLSSAYENLRLLGYEIDEDTAEAIRSVYLRYAYSGGSFSGTVAYGGQSITELDVSDFVDPSTKNASDLVVYARHAWDAGWGYVWGTFGQVLTESLLRQKIQQYPSGVGDKEAVIREKWLGGRTVDCVGFIKSYGWLDPSSMTIRYGSNGMPDIGADAMFYNAQVKGDISTIPEVPGLAVWHSGHIGIYVGNGEVIEAMGTAYGVVKTRLTERNWTAWLEIPYITYELEE